MGIFSWIILGIIAGALAKLILPGKQGGGIIVTMILGIVGAFLGGWLGSVSYTHLTLPTTLHECRSRWSP